MSNSIRTACSPKEVAKSQHENPGYSYSLFKPLVMLSLTHFCAGYVYDYYYHMGQWNVWTDAISKEESKIPDGANVSVFSSSNASKDAKMSMFLRLFILSR